MRRLIGWVVRVGAVAAVAATLVLASPVVSANGGGGGQNYNGWQTGGNGVTVTRCHSSDDSSTECKFPFSFDGTTAYDACTTEHYLDQDRPACATVPYPSYQSGSSEWVYCDPSCDSSWGHWSFLSACVNGVRNRTRECLDPTPEVPDKEGCKDQRMSWELVQCDCTTNTYEEKCVFPFYYQGVEYDTCVTRHPYRWPWCGVEEDVESYTDWDYCGTGCPNLLAEDAPAPPPYCPVCSEGAWSEWREWSPCRSGGWRSRFKICEELGEVDEDCRKEKYLFEREGCNVTCVWPTDFEDQVGGTENVNGGNDTDDEEEEFAAGHELA